MNKKLQVFVSSTYTDLVEERQAAVEAILDAGHIPAGMELFKAGNESQLKTIYKWIDESDVYMLILGGRYGSIEEKSGKSYTQLEYTYALSKNMPVFAIVLDDSFLLTKATSKGKDEIFEKDNIDKYEIFKNYVKTKVVKFVRNIDGLSTAIQSHLYDILNNQNYNLIGWIRNNKKIIATSKEMDSYIVNCIASAKKSIYHLSWKDFSQSTSTRPNYIEPESVSLTSKLFWIKLFDVNESAMSVFCKTIPNNPVKMARFARVPLYRNPRFRYSTVGCPIGQNLQTHSIHA